MLIIVIRFENMSLTEDFEADCAYVAETISSSLAMNEQHFTISIEGIHKELYEDKFVSTIAKLLGGVVDGSKIILDGKVLEISFDFWEVVEGCIEELDVIVDVL